MEWLNLPRRVLAGTAFKGSEPIARGTWIALLGFCTDEENGGRITGAALWKTRKCEQILAVTKDELHDTDGALWKIEGDDVLVNFYPIEQEKKVKANRKNGKLGGRPRTKPKPDGKTTGEPLAPPGGKRKRNRKSKGKGKVTVTPPSPPTGGKTHDDGGEPFGIHPEDLDEYGPAPNSVHPEPAPQWKHFIEHREPFERFDDFLNRVDGAEIPAGN